MTNQHIIGYGKSFSSFGEIIQGRLSSGDDFLITLPIDLWSTCELTCEDASGPSIVVCEYEKSKSVAEQMLKILGLSESKKITIEFTRNIPIGKGLSSSTADMLAVVRAFQELFGVIVAETFISNLFASIEPHDGLHFYMCAAYNHAKGSLLERLNYIPQYWIVAVDKGGVVDTCEYNQDVSFSKTDTHFFDRLYKETLYAFRERDDYEIAQCATQSSIRHLKRTGNEFLRKGLALSYDLGALGVVTTHSGTCYGLLFPKDSDQAQLHQIANRMRETVDCEVFTVKTLEILV